MTQEDNPPRWEGVPYVTGEEQRAVTKSSRMKWLGQSGNGTQVWMYLVEKVKSDAVKNNIAKKAGTVGPQFKVNWTLSGRKWQEWTSTKGISELKCTGMGKFNSDDHYIYYCWQESPERSGVGLLVNKEGWEPKNWYFQIVVLGRLLSVPGSAKKSNQSILKEIKPEYSM